jgi:hypothetical protein
MGDNREEERSDFTGRLSRRMTARVVKLAFVIEPGFHHAASEHLDGMVLRRLQSCLSVWTLLFRVPLPSQKLDCLGSRFVPAAAGGKEK